MGERLRVLTSSVAAAVLAAAALTACSGDSGSTGDSAGASSSAASSSAAAADLPPGTMWAEATSSGVKFAVPKDWTVNDPEKVLAQGDDATRTELADTLGVTVDQLDQVADQLELLVMGPADSGFSPNINVVPNTLTALPSEAAIAGELGSVGAEVSAGHTTQTPLGESIVVPYVLPVGNAEVHGRSIVAETPDGYVTLTVSTLTNADSNTLTTQLVSSLSAL